MSGPDKAKLEEAWAIFNLAAEKEHKILSDPTKADNLKRMASKLADKKLDAAVALEAEAFGVSA